MQPAQLGLPAGSQKCSAAAAVETGSQRACLKPGSVGAAGVRGRAGRSKASRHGRDRQARRACPQSERVPSATGAVRMRSTASSGGSPADRAGCRWPAGESGGMGRAVPTRLLRESVGVHNFAWIPAREPEGVYRESAGVPVRLQAAKTVPDTRPTAGASSVEDRRSAPSSPSGSHRWPQGQGPGSRPAGATPYRLPTPTPPLYRPRPRRHAPGPQLPAEPAHARARAADATAAVA
jgi:hypothetical protein